MCCLKDIVHGSWPVDLCVSTGVAAPIVRESEKNIWTVVRDSDWSHTAKQQPGQDYLGESLGHETVVVLASKSAASFNTPDG
jgi:hypothetical protein